MESNGNRRAKDERSDDPTKSKENTPTGAATATVSTTSPATLAAKTANTSETPQKSPRKRRKVNHACVYCRRSHMTCDLERPCTRCIKRNIGHLCHDEPRDPDAKKPKGTHVPATQESDIRPGLHARNSIDQTAATMALPSYDPSGRPTHALGPTQPLQLVSPNHVSGLQANGPGTNLQQFAGFSDAWLTAQNQFHDMNSYNPQFMMAPEVHNEFSLLNDFLNTSLIDDSAANLPDGQGSLLGSNQPHQPQVADLLGGRSSSGGDSNKMPQLAPPNAIQAGSMPPPSMRPAASTSQSASAKPTDKTREFYLQAADPSGHDTPEERMQRVLRAKYEAGMLKPFNYIKGYARLGAYMDGHIATASKQKILRQLDRFRPRFREKMQKLTDIELVYVEMWFEKSLTEYDRVFAAMAIPACCWRRTGEIVRGNKEMAELIHVPVERLRDAKVSLHEILTEESLVRYWEEFGTIAFDADHDTLITACTLKNPDDSTNHPRVNCCFSFMIRRDDHKIPSLIVGNFLPHDPPH